MLERAARVLDALIGYLQPHAPKDAADAAAVATELRRIVRHSAAQAAASQAGSLLREA